MDIPIIGHQFLGKIGLWSRNLAPKQRRQMPRWSLVRLSDVSAASSASAAALAVSSCGKSGYYGISCCISS